MQPAPAATLTEADVLAALRDCYDPAISLNIVDLGVGSPGTELEFAL